MMRYAVAALLAACCMSARAGAAQLTPPTPPTTDLYGEPHYELVGKLVYAYQRALGTMDEDARADLAQHAPPELVAHLARVRAEYDAIMQEHGDVPDTRLDAALREVQVVFAEIAAWRQSAAK